jgi:hypothetical protein
LRRSWRGTIEEEVESVGKILRWIKAVAGNSLMAFLHGGHVI